MAINKKQWLKSPWTIAIATTIFSFLLTMGYDFVKEMPILTTIWIILKWVGNLIWTFLNLDLKIWCHIVFFVVFTLVLYMISLVNKALEPDFLKYTEEEFSGLKWIWKWKKNCKKEWMIFDLTPLCPLCHTPIIKKTKYDEAYFICLRCNFESSVEQYEPSEKIEFLVYDNINKRDAVNVTKKG